MPFNPEPHQIITINHQEYRFAVHPGEDAQELPHLQTRRQATVYSLEKIEEPEAKSKKSHQQKALKVFNDTYRTGAMVSHARKIAEFAKLGGLAVCDRYVLTSENDRDLLSEHSELYYAVLMPWIDGYTWEEFWVAYENFTASQALKLARKLTQTLTKLEQEEIAHCDLSGANLIISALKNKEPKIELVDIEGIYSPQLNRPKELATGSLGYAHKTVSSETWAEEADRFAGAILIAEILARCDAALMELAWGDSYFNPEEMQQETDAYFTMINYLYQRWGEKIAERFEQAWQSNILKECPTFGEWDVALPSRVPKRKGTDDSYKKSPPPAVPNKTRQKKESDQELLVKIAELEAEASALANSGQTRKALGLYKEILHIVEPHKQIDITHRIEQLEEQIRISKKWICDCCGEKVDDDLAICPHCERGEKGKQCQDKKPPKSKLQFWLLIRKTILVIVILVAIGNFVKKFIIVGPQPTATASSVPETQTVTSPQTLIPTLTSTPVPPYSCETFRQIPEQYFFNLSRNYDVNNPGGIVRVHPNFPTAIYYSITDVEPINSYLASVHGTVMCFDTVDHAQEAFQGFTHSTSSNSTFSEPELGELNKGFWGESKFKVYFLEGNIVVEIKGEGRDGASDFVVRDETFDEAWISYSNIDR